MPPVPATQGKANQSSSGEAFKQAIDDFVATATDIWSQFQSTGELQAKPRSGRPAGPYPNNLAALRKRLDALTAAGDKLKRRSPP